MRERMCDCLSTLSAGQKYLSFQLRFSSCCCVMSFSHGIEESVETYLTLPGGDEACLLTPERKKLDKL